jgi:hypothetical protein
VRLRAVKQVLRSAQDDKFIPNGLCELREKAHVG